MNNSDGTCVCADGFVKINTGICVATTTGGDIDPCY